METSDLLVRIKVFDKESKLIFDNLVPSTVLIGHITLFYSPITEFSIEATWPNGRTMRTPISHPNCSDITEELFTEFDKVNQK